MRVFLSSTGRDLAKHCEAAYRAIQRLVRWATALLQAGV
jgi:hypothetical protein